MTYSDMNLGDLLYALKDCGKSTEISFILPDGTAIPSHYHVTEIGRIVKDYVDCGGQFRKEEYCSMQLWVANDVDHKLTLDKLHKILEAGRELISDNMPVIFEYQDGTVGLYFIGMIQVTTEKVKILLSGTKTSCMAPDRCGITNRGCSGSGCC